MNSLIRLDLNAIRTYEEAIEGAKSLELRTKLTEFMREHQQHVRDLSQLVRVYGARPTERRNLLGLVLEGLTALLSTGDRTALVAMRGNEEVTNRIYQMALKQELPADVRAAVQKNYEDEQRHLAWIKSSLRAVAVR